MSEIPTQKESTRYKILKMIVDNAWNREGLSMEEIAEELNLSGRPAVHYHLSFLEEEKLIKRRSGSHRSIRPTNRGKMLVKILEGEA